MYQRRTEAVYQKAKKIIEQVGTGWETSWGRQVGQVGVGFCKSTHSLGKLDSKLGKLGQVYKLGTAKTAKN